jgi:hypothetical protein
MPETSIKKVMQSEEMMRDDYNPHKKIKPIRYSAKSELRIRNEPSIMNRFSSQNSPYTSQLGIYEEINHPDRNQVK